MTRKPARNRTKHTTRWLLFLAPVAAIVGLVIIGNLTSAEEDAAGEAVEFALPDTAGGTVSLTEILDERDALLYFSMGVGCDGCFLQIPEIAAELDRRGIELVPIMAGDPAWLAADAARLGVGMPIVVDVDLSVSEAYGMLGQYGHGNVPSHSFALVRRSGELAWVRHYAEMFVPADRFFAEMPA